MAAFAKSWRIFRAGHIGRRIQKMTRPVHGARVL